MLNFIFLLFSFAISFGITEQYSTSEPLVLLHPIVVGGVLAAMTKNVKGTPGDPCSFDFVLLDDRKITVEITGFYCQPENYATVEPNSMQQIEEFGRQRDSYDLHFQRCGNVGEPDTAFCLDAVDGAPFSDFERGWNCLEWRCPGDATIHRTMTPYEYVPEPEIPVN